MGLAVGRTGIRRPGTHPGPSLAADDDLSVWQRIIGSLGQPPPPSRTGRCRSARRLDPGAARSALQRLGDTRVPGESERTTALRVRSSMPSPGWAAMSPVAPKRQHTSLALGDDPSVVDADLADATVRVPVAHTADQDTWDELRRRVLQRPALPKIACATKGRWPSQTMCHSYCSSAPSASPMRSAPKTPCSCCAGRWPTATWPPRCGTSSRPTGRHHHPVPGQHHPPAPRRCPRHRPPGTSSRGHRVHGRSRDQTRGQLVIRQHLERMWVSVALAGRVAGELAPALR